MKVWLIALGLLLALLGTRAVQAQEKVNVGAITCEQTLLGQITDSGSLMLWMSGYFHGARNNIVVDISGMKKNADEVLNYCLDHPKTSLMDAVKSVLGGNK
jgi:hypothetical protein